MKVLLVNGSQNIKKGNTDVMTGVFQHEARRKGLEVTSIKLQKLRYRGCIECKRCHTNTGCMLQDELSQTLKELHTYDAIILAFPIFNFGLNSLTQMFLERLYAYCDLHTPIGAIAVHGSEEDIDSGRDLVDSLLARFCGYTTRPYLGMIDKATDDILQPITNRDIKYVTELVKEVFKYGKKTKNKKEKRVKNSKENR